MNNARTFEAEFQINLNKVDTTMKQHRLAIVIFTVFATVIVKGQLFKPLGIGIETPDLAGDFCPQMHVEDDILFVCTKQGLYSKDLSNNESEWQLVGFEGIPLQNYARSGDDILALRYNYEYSSNGNFMLLSHDNGRSYEDITPEIFKDNRINFFLNLAQHPTAPNTLLVSSYPEGGIYLTSDFGQTWRKLSSFTPDYIGFHPMNPEIIYECDGAMTDWETDLHISYDGGQIWQKKWSCLPNNAGLYRIAFHPTDPNKWIAGGNKYVHTTNDNGLSWDSQRLDNFEIDWRYEAYNIDWRYAAYDNEDPDNVYMAGGSRGAYMKLMCSTDGGKTWNRPFQEPIKITPREFVFDMKQYRDKLLIYSQSDVYEISKSELIEQTTSIQNITNTKENATIYDLGGRKMVNGKLPKGLYIVNGKKVAIK